MWCLPRNDARQALHNLVALHGSFNQAAWHSRLALTNVTLRRLSHHIQVAQIDIVQLNLVNRS